MQHIVTFRVLCDWNKLFYLSSVIFFFQYLNYRVFMWHIIFKENNILSYKRIALNKSNYVFFKDLHLYGYISFWKITFENSKEYLNRLFTFGSASSTYHIMIRNKQWILTTLISFSILLKFNHCIFNVFICSNLT